MLALPKVFPGTQKPIPPPPNLPQILSTTSTLYTEAVPTILQLNNFPCTPQHKMSFEEVEYWLLEKRKVSTYCLLSPAHMLPMSELYTMKLSEQNFIMLLAEKDKLPRYIELGYFTAFDSRTNLYKSCLLIKNEDFNAL